MNHATALMIRLSRRSWWSARYQDGHVRHEWDTLSSGFLMPLGLGHLSRWEEIPKHGMVGLQLLCPNGLAGVLEADEGHHFFQLKAGVVFAGGQPACASHVIGVVMEEGGGCRCWAWEVTEQRLIEFTDNVFAMAYQGIGGLALDVQGLRV